GNRPRRVTKQACKPLNLGVFSQNICCSKVSGESGAMNAISNQLCWWAFTSPELPASRTNPRESVQANPWVVFARRARSRNRRGVFEGSRGRLSGVKAPDQDHR